MGKKVVKQTRSWHGKGMAAPNWSRKRFHLPAMVSGCSTDRTSTGSKKGEKLLFTEPDEPMIHIISYPARNTTVRYFHRNDEEMEAWVLLQHRTTNPSLLDFKAPCSPQLTTLPPYLLSLLATVSPISTCDRLRRPHAETSEETYFPTCIKHTHTHTHTHKHTHAYIFGCLLTGNYKFQTLQKAET